MPVLNHIHCYIKYKSRPGYFRCNNPACSHFIDKESIEGKLSLCTECGEQMVLSREDLRRAKPRCLNCSETKKAKAFRKAKEITTFLNKPTDGESEEVEEVTTTATTTKPNFDFLESLFQTRVKEELD